MPFDETAARQLLEAVRNSEGNAEDLYGSFFKKYVNPYVEEIIASKLNGLAYNPVDQNHIDDLCSIMTDKLWQGISDLPVDRLRAYISRTANSVFTDYLREKYPEHYRLENQLRYVCEQQNGLLIWQDSYKSIAGYTDWQKKKIRWDYDPATFDRGMLPPNLRAMSRKQLEDNLHDLVAALLNEIGSPIKLTALVSIVAGLLGIQLALPPPPSPSLPGTQLCILDAQIMRDYLQRLWGAITALSVGQRRALLMNLKDQDGDLLKIFYYQEIVPLESIVAALELTDEHLASLCKEPSEGYAKELEKMAKEKGEGKLTEKEYNDRLNYLKREEPLNHLPIGDEEIASLFKTKNQNVRDWRRTARERLKHTMGILQLLVLTFSLFSRQ